MAYQPPFASFMLGILVASFLTYLGYYLIMKLIYDRKKARRQRVLSPIILFIITLTFAGVALYFFVLPKTQLPWISRNENRPCYVMDFYDYHDMWHFFAACGLFFASLLLIYLDMDINHVPKSQIKVF